MKKFLLSFGLILMVVTVILAGWMCGGKKTTEKPKFCAVDDPEGAPYISKDCDEGKRCLDGYCLLVPSDNVQYAPGDYDDACVWTAAATPAPSDYACLGNNADPSVGADIPIVGRVQDFATGNEAPIGNAKLYIYSSSDVSQAPACALTSDNSDCGESCGNPPNCGKVNDNMTCKLPENSRFTYKVTVSEQSATAGGDVDFGASCGATYTGKDTYQFNILNTDNNSGSHKEEFLVIGKGIFSILPAVGQVTQQPGQGIIGGAIWDCKGNGVKFAVVTVVNASDESPVEAFTLEKDPAVVRYFRCKSGFGVVPAVEGTDADSDGLFSIFNVPPGDYLIKAYGNNGGTLTLLGKARVKTFPDAISIANLEPCQDANCTSFGQ